MKVFGLEDGHNVTYECRHFRLSLLPAKDKQQPEIRLHSRATDNVDLLKISCFSGLILRVHQCYFLNRCVVCLLFATFLYELYGLHIQVAFKNSRGE